MLRRFHRIVFALVLCVLEDNLVHHQWIVFLNLLQLRAIEAANPLIRMLITVLYIFD